MSSNNNVVVANVEILSSATTDNNLQCMDITSYDLPISDVPEDYEITRDSLQNLLSQGNDAISNLIALASASDHPRAYEVLATLIKNTSEVAMKLMEHQKKTKEVADSYFKKDKESDSGHSSQINNVAFIGDTYQLLQMIKGAIKDKQSNGT